MLPTRSRPISQTERERGERGRPVFELRDNSQSARASLAWFTSSAASQLNLWDVVMDRSRRLPSAGAGCWRRDVRSERRRKALTHSVTNSFPPIAITVKHVSVIWSRWQWNDSVIGRGCLKKKQNFVFSIAGWFSMLFFSNSYMKVASLIHRIEIRIQKK